MIASMRKNLQIAAFAKNTANEEVLVKLITKKRKILLLLIEKNEHLRIEISMIQEEYNTRVGRLFFRDNLLDLEIIRFKKVNELIESGMSYEDAILQIDGLDKKENEESEDFVFTKKGKNIPSGVEDDIKKIWKKLVHKFHPDLVTNLQEKKKRETIMKRVNHAYTIKDITTLKAIEEKELIVLEAVQGISSTQKRYIEIENAIIRLTKEIRMLKNSEWYVWTKKAKKEKEELLAHMEEKLTESIIVKNMTLRNLKRKHGNL